MKKKNTFCPNCGKRGFYVTDNCILDNKTHRCKYCEMEFEHTINKGEYVWKGDIPAIFPLAQKEKSI